jgi:signal transduction histidine kinase
MILLKPPEEIPNVKADKEKIRIVVQNLLENSIKYSNDESKIFITVGKMDDNFVEISIKDTGIGISKTGQTKVFDKFYRDDNAQKKEAVGSGIGLYTSKKIVEKHGGKIWFETAENQGSTFFFTIPIWKN